MRINRKNNRGFTLIEMLVVMAISVILMGLVLAPVIQSFNLTRRAQAMVDAQDAARQAMEQITGDLGQAMYVYDNANSPIELPVAIASGSSSSTQWFPMKFAKIDFVLPKMMMHCNNPSHDETQGPRDYSRDVLVTDATTGQHRYSYAWPKCPICKSDQVEARPKLPMQQDVTIVRYFLGLANNKLHDSTTVDPPSAAVADNQTMRGGTPPPGPPNPPTPPVSTTAENYGWVSPWHGSVETGTENQVVLYRVEFSPYDDTLFPSDMSIANRMSDSRFFYRAPYRDRWASIARVVGVGKYEDLVTAAYNNQDVVTAVDPTVTFRTWAVDNDTFAGAYSSDKVFEHPDTAPSVYNADYGYWTPDNKVTVYRDNYSLGYTTEMDSGHLKIFKWTSSTNSSPEFDITQYQQDGCVKPTDGGKIPEMGFTVDPNRGSVYFALNPPRPSGVPVTGPVCTLNPAALNAAFRTEFSQTRTGSRQAKLPTADPTISAQYLANATIVPGSERVFGPDATPGGNPSRVVRYERVPYTYDVGLNQYKIDYDTSDIYFSQVYNEDLPEGNAPISIDYKIQFNRQDDVVRGDYNTKCLVTIHLGMRMFDPESGKPHAVDLSKNIKIRNALR